MNPLVVRGARIVTPDGERAGSIWVVDGRIVGVEPREASPAGVPVLDAGDAVVLPGFVDTHVHINEPGRTEWEGFAHASRAAAAGGVTTIVDMPLNSVPSTIDAAALEVKLAAARGACTVDVGFWGGVVPGNADAIEGLARAGALGFKCFLSPSGVDEFPHVSEADLEDALPAVARSRLPLLVHAELPSRLRTPEATRGRSYAAWLESRPPEAEGEAIERLIDLARRFRTHVHIVHLAAADALEAIVAAKREGVRISVETCPHYLTFAAEEIHDGATAFKCAPPIRERSHGERLWRALADGHIDLVATDHSPSPPELKCLDSGDFVRAWGGIASLQLGARAVWTGAAARGLPVASLGRWMAEGPATLAGLTAKGGIAAGRDADLVFWNADALEEVDPSTLYHRHPLTPYAGRTLRGRVDLTMLRGEVIYRDGTLMGSGQGRIILRQSG